MPDPAKPLRVLRGFLYLGPRGNHDSWLVGLSHRGLRSLAVVALPEGREGVLTHLAMQALLGCGARGGTRRDIARECLRLFANSGAYAGSTEELTPVEADWISAVPLAMTAALLLASPQSAIKLARGGLVRICSI